MLLVALAGTVHLIPSRPYGILPYVFRGIMAVGVLYFLALRTSAPASLAAIEAEVLGET